MPDAEPPKLDYRTPSRDSNGRRFSWGQYLGGLFIGLAFSALYYMGLVNSQAGGTILLLLGAVIIKVIVGIVLAFSPNWRTFGRGILLSIPFALLLGVGAIFVICSGFKI